MIRDGKKILGKRKVRRFDRKVYIQGGNFITKRGGGKGATTYDKKSKERKGVCAEVKIPREH